MASRLYRYNYIDERLDMPLVRGGGLWVTHSHYQQSQHSHEEYEFCYVMSGEFGCSTPDGQTFTLSGGDLLIMQPRQLHGHGLDFDVVRPSSHLWLSIDPSAPDALRHSPFSESDLCTFSKGLEAAGTSAMRGDPRMSSLFRETRRVFARCRDAEDTASIPWLRSLIGQWLLMLHESLRQRADDIESPEILAVKSYIALHFDDTITLPQLASQAELSEGWFSERFLREVGMTPIDYLNRLRCTEAQKLLCSGSSSITDVAFRVGFSSSNYFSTSFRRYVGMSPSDYRSKMSRRE